MCDWRRGWEGKSEAVRELERAWVGDCRKGYGECGEDGDARLGLSMGGEGGRLQPRRDIVAAGL